MRQFARTMRISTLADSTIACMSVLGSIHSVRGSWTFWLRYYIVYWKFIGFQ